jgi:hypothetical protein
MPRRHRYSYAVRAEPVEALLNCCDFREEISREARKVRKGKKKDVSDKQDFDPALVLSLLGELRVVCASLPIPDTGLS